MSAGRDYQLVRGDDTLPPRVMQVIRNAGLDKFTGNMLLTYVDGQITGFHKTEIVRLVAREI